IKEGLLDHTNITGDGYGYSGQSDENGRWTLACLGAHIISDALFGELALRRGPDERRLRECYLAIAGIKRRLAKLEEEVQAEDARLSALPDDANISLAEVVRHNILKDNVRDL